MNPESPWPIKEQLINGCLTEEEISFMSILLAHDLGELMTEGKDRLHYLPNPSLHKSYPRPCSIGTAIVERHNKLTQLENILLSALDTEANMDKNKQRSIYKLSLSVITLSACIPSAFIAPILALPPLFTIPSTIISWFQYLSNRQKLKQLKRRLPHLKAAVLDHTRSYSSLNMERELSLLQSSIHQKLEDEQLNAIGPGTCHALLDTYHPFTPSESM